MFLRDGSWAKREDLRDQRQVGRHVDLLTTKAFSWKLPGGPGNASPILADLSGQDMLQHSARQPGQLQRVVGRRRGTPGFKPIRTNLMALFSCTATEQTAQNIPLSRAVQIARHLMLTTAVREFRSNQTYLPNRVRFRRCQHYSLRSQPLKRRIGG